MPELRQNIATKEWVIIATERAKRPVEFVESTRRHTIEAEPLYDPNCPFCPGNEERDLQVEQWPELGTWQTRVVRNKYPALRHDAKLEREFAGVHPWISGVGHHEVVVDHPQHNTTWALMTTAEIHTTLETIHRRGQAIQANPQIEQIIYFKNHGRQAGASLKHPHCQIMALPIVPSNNRYRLREAQRYFDDYGQCAYQVMLNDELKPNTRVVAATEHFVAFVLYAAPSPFHIWILARRQMSKFVHTNAEELVDLAEILRDVLRRLYIGLHDPSYNMIIRTGPAQEPANKYWQWYVTIVPRVARTAGFELGSGMFINPALPEESAKFLRDVKI